MFAPLKVGQPVRITDEFMALPFLIGRRGLLGNRFGNRFLDCLGVFWLASCVPLALLVVKRCVVLRFRAEYLDCQIHALSWVALFTLFRLLFACCANVAQRQFSGS